MKEHLPLCREFSILFIEDRVVVDQLLAWLCIWFDTFNTCGGLRSNGAGQTREADEEHDEDCVE